MQTKQPKTNSSRVCIRLPCELQADVTFSGGGIEYTRSMLISNISTTGIQILSPSFIATGQTVKARFKVPGQNDKATLQAEVMRVESMQRRGAAFPYALGARFTESAEMNEKQITEFILYKMSCVKQRRITAALFLTLGLIESLRAALSFSGAQSTPFLLAAFGFTAAPAWISAVLSTGLIVSGIFCQKNMRFFPAAGFFWAGIQLIIASLTLGATTEWLGGKNGENIAWIIGAGVWLANAAVIALLIYLTASLKKNRKLLFSEKISLRPNQPSFTIL